MRFLNFISLDRIFLAQDRCDPTFGYFSGEEPPSSVQRRKACLPSVERKRDADRGGSSPVGHSILHLLRSLNLDRGSRVKLKGPPLIGDLCSTGQIRLYFLRRRLLLATLPTGKRRFAVTAHGALAPEAFLNIPETMIWVC
jgi:hypothetical protein